MSVLRRPGGKWPIPETGVYIGRPSKWGNPFHIGRDGTRAEVVEKYRNWIAQAPHLLADLHELKGKDLYCWCAPEACHGDVLEDLANRCDCGHHEVYHFDDGEGVVRCRATGDCACAHAEPQGVERT